MMRAFTALLFALLAASAAAQTFPQKPIRIIVPYPPGGPSDMQARLIDIELTKAWGQTSVIDNRGGGSGIIGTELVARADADGHTLIIMSGTNAVQATNASLTRSTSVAATSLRTTGDSHDVSMIAASISPLNSF